MSGHKPPATIILHLGTEDRSVDITAFSVARDIVKTLNDCGILDRYVKVEKNITGVQNAGIVYFTVKGVGK